MVRIIEAPLPKKAPWSVRTALEAISKLLGRLGDSGSFVTRRSVPARSLKLQVRGVGPIRLPVSPATAARLCESAHPARHGFKDQTRLDRQVRDSWEIPPRRIVIDEARWLRALTPELARIRHELGMPEGCTLKAALHSLLVYAPGQFFRPHQDSEKDHGMIGTLVVTLPSQLSGGAMLIEHRDAKKLVHGSTRDLTLIAFYADCHHEVRPVRRGHRIVLTYNLILQGEPATALPDVRLQALTRGVRDFFEQDRPEGPPDRLIYLLDYQYTRHGLAWHHLKGGDTTCAAALREVARRLGCDIHLALADVHETWACEEEYVGGERHARRFSDDDAEADEPSSATPELRELLNSDIELRFVGRGVPRRALAAPVDDDELCYSTPSVQMKPFESRHEGYMGNYGNTVDHWYHRAAIVLWPKDRTFILRAKSSPLWAIGQIDSKLRARRAATEALALAQRLLPFWRSVQHREDSAALLAAVAPVAAKLGDPELAAGLLQPYTLIDVRAGSAPALAGLLERYGVDWWRTLLHGWMTSEKAQHVPPRKRLTWQGSALSPLSRALCARNAGRGLAREIVAAQWAFTRQHIGQLQQAPAATSLRNELTRLGKPVVALIETAVMAQAREVHHQILEALKADADELMPLRVAVLRAAQRGRSRRTAGRLGLKAVHARCVRELTRQLQAPPRARNDWSITTPIGCSCKLCQVLARYLAARDEVLFEWPLAHGDRAHIQAILDLTDLPVRREVRQSGRPFTLVLEKTSALFERAAAERRALEEDLKWLKATAKGF